jgi:hypothetical protein
MIEGLRRWRALAGCAQTDGRHLERDEEREPASPHLHILQAVHDAAAYGLGAGYAGQPMAWLADLWGDMAGLGAGRFDAECERLLALDAWEPARAAFERRFDICPWGDDESD